MTGTNQLNCPSMDQLSNESRNNAKYIFDIDQFALLTGEANRQLEF